MTVSTALLLVAGLGAALAACLIGTAVLWNFSWWALRMLWVQSCSLTRALSRLLIASVAAICKGCSSSLRFMYELAATALVVVAVPPLRRTGQRLAAMRDSMAAKRRGLLAADSTAVPDVPSAAPLPPAEAVPAAKARSVRQQADRKAAEPVADEELAWALSVMGFASAEAITSVDLKMRYTEMMKLVHPEKGFPNEVFANQINKARETIRRTRGLS